MRQRAIGVLQALIDLPLQPGHGGAELAAAARGFAQPEGNRGGLAVGVFDPDPPGLHAQDAIRRVA